MPRRTTASLRRPAPLLPRRCSPRASQTSSRSRPPKPSPPCRTAGRAPSSPAASPTRSRRPAGRSAPPSRFLVEAVQHPGAVHEVGVPLSKDRRAEGRGRPLGVPDPLRGPTDRWRRGQSPPSVRIGALPPAPLSPGQIVALIRNFSTARGNRSGGRVPAIWSKVQSRSPVFGSRPTRKADRGSGRMRLPLRHGNETRDWAQLVLPTPATFQAVSPLFLLTARTYGSVARSTHRKARSVFCSTEAETPWRLSTAPNSRNEVPLPAALRRRGSGRPRPLPRRNRRVRCRPRPVSGPPWRRRRCSPAARGSPRRAARASFRLSASKRQRGTSPSSPR